MKKITSTLILVLVFITSSFAQFQTEEQLFGSKHLIKNSFFDNTRSSENKSIDRSEIKLEEDEFELFIFNNEIVPMTIINVTLPQGVSILLPQKEIAPSQKGFIKAIVYQEFVNKDQKNNYSELVEITVELKSIKGIITQKTYTFELKGQFE